MLYPESDFSQIGVAGVKAAADFHPMHKELEIWNFAARRLKRGEALMLLVVAASSGSSPGRQGFKMIVAEDELAGSIGGGVMEIDLVEAARTLLFREKARRREEVEEVEQVEPVEPVEEDKRKTEIRNRRSEIIERVHRKNSRDSSGMICSGRQTVVLFELKPEDLKTVRRIIGALRRHRPLILRISDLELEVSDVSQGDFDFDFARFGESEFLYEEKLGFKNKLFIVGGGHCALALSELMSKMDFHISLFDDRSDLNTLAKNKFAHRKTIIDSYDNINRFIESGKDIYVVVMTLGYKFDGLVIRKLFDKNFKYFGVLGSRAKMKTLLRNLEKEGFSPEKLRRIRTPIGLKINSRTPVEIAVSIAAEIVAVKNKADLS